MNVQIARVAMVGILLLGALIVATTYWQVWASASLAAHEDNQIGQIAQVEVRRGLIYAANGKTLLAANTAVTQNGQTIYNRVYPNGDLAAQTVGYSTPSLNRSGVEEAENSYLTAANGDLGTVLGTLSHDLKGTTVTGNNIVLTINARVQRLAQQLLKGTCGAAVVLNPTTGAISVMASTPGFDPNAISTAKGYAAIVKTPSPCAPEPASPLLNRATQGLYPPGSIFKTITAATALTDHVYGLDSMFYDPGYCTEYGRPIHNALDQGSPEAYGNVNFVQAYEYSLNSVFCNIGQKLGAERIITEAKQFGFYTVPPLETPADERVASGLYVNGNLFDPSTPAQWDSVDPGRLAFGQANMLVTPLQMALVASAIADNGREMTPTLVKSITTPGGNVLSGFHPTLLRTATSPQVAADIRHMMVEVVAGGTGTEAQIPGIVVAGKTGTAEVVTGSDYYDAWFLFLAPADHPTVAGAIVVQHQLNGFGGAIAAPIAKQLIEALLPASDYATGYAPPAPSAPATSTTQSTTPTAPVTQTTTVGGAGPASNQQPGH